MAKIEPSRLEDLQALVSNKLDVQALAGGRLTVILGDAPSTYAKSPKLWNAAFKALGLGAAYIPLDVPQDRLPGVVAALRANAAFLGGSVTVPYKQAILPLLDDLDPLAARIGAVNAFARTRQGRLVGYNTDGLGGLRALITPSLSGAKPLIEDISHARVLLIGAGGAAQAMAFSLWERMPRGSLVIVNRALDAAQALAKRLAAARDGRVSALPEASLHDALEADLVVNTSVKGQSGVRKLADGRWTCLEPYSALGPAQPDALVPPSGPDAQARFLEAWLRGSRADILRNEAYSLEACARLPRPALCYDIIYSPLETTFLRHARLSGHATFNGREMNVAQAVEAFMRYVCREWLLELGLEPEPTRVRVEQAMAEEWGK